MVSTTAVCTRARPDVHPGPSVTHPATSIGAESTMAYPRFVFEGLFSPWHLLILAVVLFVVVGPRKVAARWHDLRDAGHRLTGESDDEDAGPAKIKDVFAANTRGKDKCNTYAACKTLLDEGKTIEYQGASAIFPHMNKFGKFEPDAGAYEIWSFDSAGRDVVQPTDPQIRIG